MGFIYVRKTHIFAVALGGALGALARLSICSFFDSQISAVFVCNLIGSFLLAAAVELRKRIHEDVENMVSVGFCGGLSIFSSFSRDSVMALAADNYFLFFTNLFANFALCVLMVYLAQYIASQVRAHRDFLREKRRRLAVALHLKPKNKTLGEKISDAAENIRESVKNLGGRDGK